MRQAKLRFLKILSAAALLVLAAALCRYIAWRTDSAVTDKLAVLARDYLYLGLLFVWSVSVRRRIMQTQVRRMLFLSAQLMIFWLVMREWKFRFVADVAVSRYLWYLYYVPLLLIPLLALFISMSLGKAQTYRLPAWTGLFYAPTLVLLFLVLTNDLHGFAFQFTQGVRDEFHYTYGWLYYAVTVWIYLCSLLAFGIMVTKLRVPQSKKFLWLPLVPFMAAAGYGALYVVRRPLAFDWFGDLTVVFCLSFIGFFESCIQCGLIQSNTGYAALFDAGRAVCMQIADSDYHIRYCAHDAQPVRADAIRAAVKAPVMTDEKTLLRAMPIDGGYAVWTEDIAPLTQAREMLRLRGEELADRNDFLKLEYEKETAHKTVEEQNRLYDLLQRKTQPQLDKMEGLIAACRMASGTEKQRLLAQIIVLGSYIKRRKNFVLSVDETELIEQEVLADALEESFRALRLLGIGGSYYVACGDELQTGSLLMEAYDFFETVTEAVMKQARYLNVRVCQVDGVLRVSILTDCAAEDAVTRQYPAVRIEEDEDGTSYILIPEGGGSA